MSEALPPDSVAVPRRALRASVALLSRQVVVHGLNALAGVLLARWLTPSEFGVWGIVTFTLVSLTVVGDLGLGAGLVREPREPDERDYRAVMACQHALTLTLGVALWLLAPLLASAYRLPTAGVAMFRFIAASLPVAAVQTVSAIRMERSLAFGRLAVVEVTQAVVYNAVLLGLVRSGAGVVAFGAALLVRAATGAALAWALAPWRLGWRFDPERVRALLAFGLPYQGVGIVSLLKDSIAPIVVAALLGTAAVGAVQWAQLTAAYPVMALMALQRVYLPSFARLQHDVASLGRLLENALRMTHAIVAPVAVGTLVLVDPAVRLVFGEKWRPALPLFYLLWSANLVVPTATPLAGLLNALGLSRVTFAFAVVWMAVTWIAGVPALLAWGVVGYGIANVVVQATSLFMIPVARRRVPFRVLPVVATPWLLAAVMGLALAGLDRLHPAASVAQLVGQAAAGLALYAGLVALVWRDRLLRVFRELSTASA